MTGRDYTRHLVRVRDNHTCQDCGERRTPKQVKKTKKRLFDVHHLNGMCGKKSRGYDSVMDISGLITLCHKCHFNRPEHKSKQKESSKKDRNTEVCLLIKKGLSLSEVGKKYAISKQRVHQIVKRSYQQV